VPVDRTAVWDLATHGSSHSPVEDVVVGRHVEVFDSPLPHTRRCRRGSLAMQHCTHFHIVSASRRDQEVPKRGRLPTIDEYTPPKARIACTDTWKSQMNTAPDATTVRTPRHSHPNARVQQKGALGLTKPLQRNSSEKHNLGGQADTDCEIFR
jgi:hypothetical protein